MNSSNTVNTVTDKSLFDQVTDSLRRFANVSEILRLVGAVIVLASMSLFLLQGWADTEDFQRFGMMLGNTVMLGIAGFAMHKVLKENKSARLFFALALVAVTANFTTLGALTYSLVQWDTPSADYPQFAYWVMSDVSSLLIALAASVVVLLPLARFGFAVLFRQRAGILTVGYIAVNLLLLVPVRDVTIALAIALAGILLVLKLFDAKSRHLPLEARFAQFMLLLPPFILGFRSIAFYALDEVSLLAIAIAAYIVLRQISQAVNGGFRRVVEAYAIAAALWVACQFAALLPTEPQSMVAWGVSAAFAGLCFDLYRVTNSSAMRSAITHIAAVVIAACFALNQLFAENAFSFISALLAGAGILVTGVTLRLRALVLLGAGLMLGTLSFYMSDFITVVVNAGWISLAIIGGLTIVLAAVIDRYGTVIQLKWQQIATKKVSQQ